MRMVTALFIMLQCGPVTIAIASLDKDIELMRSIAAQNKANRTGIVTWQGNATVEAFVDGYDVNMRRRSTVEFVCDQSQSAVRWDWSDQGQSGGEEQLQVPEYERRFSIGMRKGDRYYRYMKLNIAKPNTLLIQPRQKLEVAKRGRAFDPMWYLGIFEYDVAEHLEYLCSTAERLGNMPWKVLQQGDVVSVERCEAPGINRLVFDMNQSGLLVEYFGKDSESEVVYKIAWQEQGGCRVPYQYSVRNVSGKHVQERVVRFTRNRVNEPVAPDEFTYEKLGLQPGDEIQDQLVGIVYRYKYSPTLDEAFGKQLPFAEVSAIEPCQVTPGRDDSNSTVESDLSDEGVRTHGGTSPNSERNTGSDLSSHRGVWLIVQATWNDWIDLRRSGFQIASTKRVNHHCSGHWLNGCDAGIPDRQLDFLPPGAEVA